MVDEHGRAVFGFPKQLGGPAYLPGLKNGLPTRGSYPRRRSEAFVFRKRPDKMALEEDERGNSNRRCRNVSRFEGRFRTAEEKLVLCRGGV